MKDRPGYSEREGIIVSDMHVGSYAGLVPPEFFINPKKNAKLRASQEETFAHFKRFTEENQGIDILLVNGDCIDGKGGRVGGIELWSTDLIEQAEAAAILLNMFKAKRIVMSYGTSYHVAADSGERLEKIICGMVNGEIGDRPFMRIGGVIIDMRHFIGSSSVPHCRATALAREGVWDSLLHERGKFPKVDVLIRSHTHYHVYYGDVRHLCMVTPALQLPGTIFGASKCSGDIDWGIIKFNAKEGKFSWKAEIVNLNTAKVKVKDI
jgi:hypothetical protein